MRFEIVQTFCFTQHRGISGKRRLIIYKFTGTPALDAGIAAVAALNNKKSFGEVTTEDMQKMSDWLYQLFMDRATLTVLGCAYTGNTAFFQQGWKSGKHAWKSKVGTDAVLLAFQEDKPRLEKVDKYLGLPVTGQSLKAEGGIVGRAYRQHIPMLSGEKVLNNGSGVLASPEALLFFHAFPFGSLYNSGLFTIFHTEDEALMISIAKRSIKEFSTALAISKATGAKMQIPSQSLFNLLYGFVMDNDVTKAFCVYQLTNYADKANAAFYRMDTDLLRFFAKCKTAKYKGHWARVVRESYRKKNKKEENIAHKALIKQFSGSGEVDKQDFITRCLLTKKRDPVTGTKNWAITKLYLKEYMKMQQNEIDSIQSFSDLLKTAILSLNKRSDQQALHDGIFGRKSLDEFRDLCLKINTALVSSGQAQIFTSDNCMLMFPTVGDNTSEAKIWRRTRAYIGIYLQEKLTEAGWTYNAPKDEQPKEEGKQ